MTEFGIGTYIATWSRAGPSGSRDQYFLIGLLPKWTSVAAPPNFQAFRCPTESTLKGSFEFRASCVACAATWCTSTSVLDSARAVVSLRGGRCRLLDTCRCARPLQSGRSLHLQLTRRALRRRRECCRSQFTKSEIAGHSTFRMTASRWCTSHRRALLHATPPGDRD